MSPPERSPITPHGRVLALVQRDGRAGALVEVRCSSAAFARSGRFVEYVDRLCRHVLEQGPGDLDELAGQDWSYEGGTVADAQRRFSDDVGESVRVKRLARFHQPEGRIWGYTNPDHRRGVLLDLRTGAGEEALRDVAFQLAGQILVDRCGELVMGERGPEEIFDVDALLLQPWTRGPQRTIGEALEAELGEGTKLRAYARFDVG